MEVLEETDQERCEEVKNTFKFRTVVFLILGVVCLSTLATAIFFSPLLFYLAWRSYQEGSDQDPAGGASTSPLDELKKLKELLDSGALTQEEFDALKKKLISFDD